MSDPQHIIAVKRPLVDLAFCQFTLDKSEDQVLWLIQDGSLAIVFDLKRQSARFPTYRILTSCLMDYIGGVKRDYNAAKVSAAIESLFPLPFNPSARSVARKLTCGSTHVIHLLRDKTLAAGGGEWRRGPGGSPKVNRTSLLNFLFDRLVSRPSGAFEISEPAISPLARPGAAQRPQVARFKNPPQTANSEDLRGV